jgi:hypothetical protein
MFAMKVLCFKGVLMNVPNTQTVNLYLKNGNLLYLVICQEL